MPVEQTIYTTPRTKDEQFLDNLDIAIKFYRESQNDAYNINFAVSVALADMKTCYELAMQGKTLIPKP